MRLLNKKTMVVEDVSPDMVGQKFLSGEYAFHKNDPVPLVDEGGEIGHYTPDSIYDAVNRGGYKFPTSDQLEEYRLNKQYGDRPASSFALGAADAPTFGMASQFLGRSGIVSKEALKQIPERNPISHGAGFGAGVIGSLFLGPEAAMAKTAQEALTMARASGNTAKIVQAEEALRKAKNALTTLDAVNPVSAVSKVAGSLADKVVSAPIPSIMSQATKAGVREGLEGLAYTAGELNRESALGDPPKTAGEIVSTLGFGTVLSGGLGAMLGGGIQAGKTLKSKLFPKGTFSEAVQENIQKKVADAGLSEQVEETLAATQKPLSLKSLTEIEQAAKSLGKFDVDEALPTMQEAIDLSNRLPIKLKPHALQLESLRDEGSRIKYSSWLDSGTEAAHADSQLQAGQKKELTDLVKKTIKDIAPGGTDDELISGQKLIKSLDDKFSDAKGVLGPQFEKFDNAGVNLIRAPEIVVDKINSSLPGLEKYLDIDLANQKIALKPYNDGFPYNNNVHSALRRTVKVLNNEDATIGEIRNVARKLGAQLDRTKEGYGTDKAAIQRIKTALSDFVADEIDKIDPTVQARELNKSYAILKGNEKSIGEILGDNPERAVKRIFSNFNNVSEAKNILSKEEFDEAAKSFLSSLVKNATDQETKIFSSKKLATALNKNRIVLEEAFRDTPGTMQTIRDATALMKILPDRGPVNTSRTAPVTFNLLKTLIEPMDSLKKTIFGIKEGLEAQRNEAILNKVLEGGQTFQSAEAEINKEWRKFNAVHKINEMTEKSNSKMKRLIKKAVGPAEYIAEKSIAPVSAKIVTPQKRRESSVESKKEAIKDFKKATKKIGIMVNNPSHFIDEITTATNDLHDISPAIAMEVQSSLIAGVQFLSSKIPKKQTDGFFDKEFVPSMTQINTFFKYYDAVEDPMTVLSSLANNTVSTEQVETLANVYPGLYEEMKLGVFEELVDIKHQPTYQKKLSISLFLGQNVDNSLSPQMIAASQNSFAMMNGGKSATADGNIKATQKGLGKLSVASRSITPLDKAAQRTESRET